MSECLSGRHRLHHRRDFLNFFGKNRFFRWQECLVFQVPNECGHFRLGMTLKARGSSVERNRVKRTVREQFRRAGDQLGAYDYNVVIPQSKRIDRIYAQKLSQEIEQSIEQIFGPKKGGSS